MIIIEDEQLGMSLFFFGAEAILSKKLYRGG